MLPAVITTTTTPRQPPSPSTTTTTHLLELTVPLVSMANANAVGKLLLEPKASSAIVFGASALALLCSVWHVPYAVVILEAIGWSGLAHLVRHAGAVNSAMMETAQDDITVSADAEDDHACVLAELRTLFRSSTTTPLLLRY